MRARSFGTRLWRWVLVLATVCLLGPAAAQEVGVAARVNGREISVFRLERHFEDFLKERGRNVGAMRSPVAYKRLKREALEQLIDRELLADEAARRGIVVSDADVAIARAATEAGFKGRDAFLRRIGEAGFTTESFDAYLRQGLAAERALQVLTQDAQPSEDELRAIYAETRERFKRPEELRARHILIKVPATASAAEKEAARQKLLAVLGEIRAGGDFATLARQRSEDASAAAGGDLGFFARGRMVPPFEALAFSLAPGETGGPVETVFGWHLIRVEARRPAASIPEAEALAMIRAQLLKARGAEAERQALARLRAAASVEVLLAF